MNQEKQKTIDKHRILFVDDDIALRDLVVDYLSASGYPMEVAGDGPGMLSVLGKYAVDLVVLVLCSPGKMA